MTRAFLVALALSGCGAGRRFDVELTGDPAVVATVAQVSLQLYDGDRCTCADLTHKTGCLKGDDIAALTFSATRDHTTARGLPAGKLVIQARATSTSSNDIPLRIDCWCVDGADDTPLVYALGLPRDPAGMGCAP